MGRKPCPLSRGSVRRETRHRPTRRSGHDPPSALSRSIMPVLQHSFAKCGLFLALGGLPLLLQAALTAGLGLSCVVAFTVVQIFAAGAYAPGPRLRLAAAASGLVLMATAWHDPRLALLAASGLSHTTV